MEFPKEIYIPEDSKDDVSLTGLSYTHGSISQSAPCSISGEIVDAKEGEKGYVSKSDSERQCHANKASLDPSKTDTSEYSSKYIAARKSLFVVYAGGDMDGEKVRTRMEEKGMKCLDCQRDYCYGQPEMFQIENIMKRAAWIILYLPEVYCDQFHKMCQMAIAVAKQSRKEKVVNLVSSTAINIPQELKLFRTILVKDDDWLAQLEGIVYQEPEESSEGMSLVAFDSDLHRDCLDELEYSDVSDVSLKNQLKRDLKRMVHPQNSDESENPGLYQVDTDSNTALQTAAERGCDIGMKVGADLTIQNAFGNTQLHIAAENGSKECVEVLLKTGADANIPNANGDTPLHMASENGFNECVDMLLKAGANVNVMNTDGYTPLQKAFKNGFNDCADTLTKAGAHVNEQNQKDCTPLHKTGDAGAVMTLDATLKAWSESDVQIKDTLISGYNVKITTPSGDKQLATTIKEGLENNKERINRTLQRVDAKVTSINLGCVDANVEVKKSKYDSEQLKLIIATLNEVISEITDIILMTISPHADRSLPLIIINTGDTNTIYNLGNAGNIMISKKNSGSMQGTVTSTDRQTDLTKCLEVVRTEKEEEKDTLCSRNIYTRDQEDIQNKDVKKRLPATKWESKCAISCHTKPVNIPNSNGYTQLHLAVKNGSKECVQLLIDSGADVDVRNGDRNTPLHIAAEIGSKEFINLLMSSGAAVNVRNRHDNTPLHIAAQIGSEECINVLMSSGAAVNVRNRHDNTPLHIAAEIGSKECINLLVSAGAVVNVKNRHGNTPLHIAAQIGSTECINVLMSSGADVNVQNGDGNVPGHIAVTNNFLECLKKLYRVSESTCHFMQQ